MTNLKAKLTTGIVTAALFASTFAPAAAFADTTVTIKDNGKDSFNLAVVKNKKKTVVWQYNGTAVINKVGVLQNTGGNDANGNTGGNTTVSSGNATSHVTNNTTTGGNEANVEPCGCDSNTTVKITDNGKDSTNIAIVKNTNTTWVVQTNETLVVNAVWVGQNTGNNDANGNTGGNVSVDSGNASSTVTNNTTTGGNSL